MGHGFTVGRLGVEAQGKKGVIRIKQDFSFERRIRMASFDDLVRQMKRVGKKYRGRCEPALLVRTLFVDGATAPLYGSRSTAKSTGACAERADRKS